MGRRQSIFACAFGLGLTAVNACADTRITYRVEGDAPMVESVLVGAGNVRVNQRGGQHWLLYDRGTATLYQVDAGRRQYMQINAAQMQRQQRLIAKVARHIDAQWPAMIEFMRALDGAPAFQNPGTMARKYMPRVSAILREQGAAEADLPTQAELVEVYAMFDQIDRAGGWEQALRNLAKAHYQWALDNTGSYQVRRVGKRTVDGRRCVETQVSLAMKVLPKPTRIIDYCVALPGALQLPAAEQAVLDAFAVDSAKVVGEVAELLVVPAGIARELGIASTIPAGVDQITLDGIPLRSQVYDSQQRLGATSNLAEVASGQRFEPGLFRLPPGYRKLKTESTLQKALDSSIATIATLVAVEDAAK